LAPARPDSFERVTMIEGPWTELSNGPSASGLVPSGVLLVGSGCFGDSYAVLGKGKIVNGTKGYEIAPPSALSSREREVENGEHLLVFVAPPTEDA
jgi:hypothetical protein